MPYDAISELPDAVKKLSKKKQRQWMAVWNSSHEAGDDEGTSFAKAWGAVKEAALRASVRVVEGDGMHPVLVDARDDLERLRDAMAAVAAADTSYAPADEYEASGHPLYGHCAAAAYAVQKRFGGDQITGRVDGVRHLWNRLPDGTEVDLTSDQFEGGDGLHPVPGAKSRKAKPRKTVNRRFKAFDDRITRYMTRAVAEAVAGELGPDPAAYARTFELRDSLPPEIFDEEGRVRPEVRAKLLLAADDFWDSMDATEGVEPLDVLLVGSLAGYSWSEFSDVDLHVLAEYSDIDEDEELVRDYGMKARSVWNHGHDVRVGPYEVEVYLQDAQDPHITPGIYSLVDDMWVVEPTKERPVVDLRDAVAKAEALMRLADDAVEALASDSERGFELVDRFKDKLYRMRQAGLEEAGLYSVENVAFKMLRRNGYIDKVKDATKAALDAELSVDAVDESAGARPDYGCVLVRLPEEVAALFLEKAAEIPDEQVVALEGTHVCGRETDPHVTVKYGLHTDDPADVEELLCEYGPVEVTLQGVEAFDSSPEYDVLYVAVESEDLRALNRLITAKLECTDSHPEYVPHATLAYVAKGAGASVVGDSFAEGETFTADRAVFSSKDGDEKEILLSGSEGS